MQSSFALKENEAFEFSNWAQTVKQRPHFYHEPSSNDDLQGILARVKDLNSLGSGGRHLIKVIGKGHSPNEICVHKPATT
jgi:hypothetical protein